MLGSVSFADLGSDWINHGSNPILDNVRVGTWMLWIYLDNVNNTFRGVAGKQQTWQIYKPGADGTQIRFDYPRTTTYLSIHPVSGTFAAGKWYYIAFLVDPFAGNSEQRMFIGEEGARATEPSYSSQVVGSGLASDDSSFDLYVGTYSHNTAFSIGGDIAAFAFYERYMQVSEVLEHQNAWSEPLDKDYCRVFSKYHGIGTQLDYSGYRNHGIVTGAAAGRPLPLALDTLRTRKRYWQIGTAPSVGVSIPVLMRSYRNMRQA